MGTARQSHEEIENAASEHVNPHPMHTEYASAEAYSAKSDMGTSRQSREEIENVAIDRINLHPMGQQERSTSVDQDIRDNEDSIETPAEGYSAASVNVKSMHVDEHLFQYPIQETVDTTNNHAMHVAYPIHPVGKSVDPRNEYIPFGHIHENIAFGGGDTEIEPINQATIQNQDLSESRTYERSDIEVDRSRIESHSRSTLYSSRYQSASFSSSSGSYSSRSGSYDDDTSYSSCSSRS